MATVDDMTSIQAQLMRWSQSRCPSVSVGGLLARSKTSHKWKAPYRSLVVREALLWRMHDLGQQIALLIQQDHILGARILLRSAIETLAILIYLNQKTSSVINGSLSFFEFDEITKKLMMGSKDGTTNHAAVNILTVLEKAETSYVGLTSMHRRLSESAHPNFDGVLFGYTSSNPDEYETSFENNWIKYFSREQEPATAFVFAIFEFEYNDTWRQLMIDLEAWLQENDLILEAQKIEKMKQ
jgi:hypothetical protein